MNTGSRKLRVYVVDDQEIYGPVYQPIFASDGTFELVGVESNRDGRGIASALAGVEPDVLVAGVRHFGAEVGKELSEIRKRFPLMGIVVLLVFVDVDGGACLRRFLLQCKSGVALYLRHSLDSVDQLCKMVVAAGRGQIVLDPMIASAILPEKQEPAILKQLTRRELEIIKLLAEGYTNEAIAGELYIDIKTVEHHLNSIYSKMKSGGGFEKRHPRVTAARMYLETVGELTSRSDETAREPGSQVRPVGARRGSGFN